MLGIQFLTLVLPDGDLTVPKLGGDFVDSHTIIILSISWHWRVRSCQGSPSNRNFFRTVRRDIKGPTPRNVKPVVDLLR